MTIRQTIVGCVTATIMAGFAGVASASTIGPVATGAIPDGGGLAPGWTSVGGTGIAFPGGKQWKLENIDQSAFDQLWYGFYDPEGAMDGSVNSLLETLSYNAGLSDSDTGVWLGQTTVHTLDGAISVDTRFTMEIIAGGSFVATPAAISGLSPELDEVVAEITGSTFEILFTLEAMNAIAGIGPSDVFTAFLPYYVPSTKRPVPAPAAPRSAATT